MKGGESCVFEFGHSRIRSPSAAFLRGYPASPACVPPGGAGGLDVELTLLVDEPQGRGEVAEVWSVPPAGIGPAHPV